MFFYGRETQKKQIHTMFTSDKQTVALIYGRRRIGKSELIKQCLRETDVTSIYYECKQTSEMNNVEGVSEIVSEIFGFPKLAFSGMEELLKFLFEKSTMQKFIFVLDEYPYMRESMKGLDSILQSLIDTYQDRSMLKLIVCGSYVDTMRGLLERQNPLYGRVDVGMELGPMDYYESSLFYGSFSDEDKVRLYSVFGGVPYYNRLINEAETVRENMINLIVAPGARLENEVPMYLNSEISKIINANEVFETLAKGFSKYKDILDQSHVSSAPTLVDVLDKLIRMDVVKKETPINDENNRKRARYFVSDNLSLFYYKYIFRNISRRSIMNPDVFYDKYIHEDFETKHVPHIFEEIGRQYLIRKNRAGKMEEPFDQIGKYYYDDPEKKKNGDLSRCFSSGDTSNKRSGCELDIVTHDDKGYIFYEAKFRKEPLRADLIAAEIAQVQSAGLPCYKYGFISRSGFEGKETEEIILIGLEKLYEVD